MLAGCGSESPAYEEPIVSRSEAYSGSEVSAEKETSSETETEVFTGISEDEVADSLEGISVTADNEKWVVKKDNIKSLSIERHQTDPRAMTDTVAVTVTIEHAVEEANGQLIIDYVFDKTWQIASIHGNEHFAASVKPGMELDVTNETLINDISGQTFEYGTNDYTSILATGQVITVGKDEISDFVIEDMESSEKGTVKKYYCSCKLSKQNAEFTLDIEVQYNYTGSGEWETWVEISAECDSINLEGSWTGSYNKAGGGGSAALEITDIGSDGTVTGVFSYTPNRVDKTSQQGSYSVEAEIVLSTLKVHFKAGEWIDYPGDRSLALKISDISATLDVENATLYGVISSGGTVTLTQ